MIDPYCDTAWYNLGVLAFYYQIEPAITDNLGALTWSNNPALIATSYYRSAIHLNPKNIFALTELAVLIKFHDITAEPTDFFDGDMPVRVDDQVAKILRYVRAVDFYHPRATYHLGKLFEEQVIPAMPEDFIDGNTPASTVDQAAILYRISLCNTHEREAACSRLGILVNERLVIAIPSDFSDEEMPTTVPEQAANLFRRGFIAHNKACADALFGLAGLIAAKQIKLTEKDYQLFDLSAENSAEEQAATLYRKIINLKINNSKNLSHSANIKYHLAVLELAQLIITKKVLPSANDYSGCAKVYYPLSDHLKFMVGHLLQIGNHRITEKAKLFLPKIQTLKNLEVQEQIQEDKVIQQELLNKANKELDKRLEVNKLIEKFVVASKRSASLMTIAEGVPSQDGMFADSKAKKPCDLSNNVKKPSSDTSVNVKGATPRK
jgi:hypothetical protein